MPQAVRVLAKRLGQLTTTVEMSMNQAPHGLAQVVNMLQPTKTVFLACLSLALISTGLPPTATVDLTVTDKRTLVHFNWWTQMA